MEAGSWFESKFPLRWEYLVEAGMSSKPMKEFDYEELIEELRDKLTGLELQRFREDLKKCLT